MSNEGSAWDVYREIHKAMRFALFGVTARAGSAEATNESDLEALRNEWRDVAFVLRGHHEHEDTFCDPLIRAHAPSLREALESEHVKAHDLLMALDTQAAALTSARPQTLRAFYLNLADFTADYLKHLRYEEDRVMPALNHAMSDAQLAAVTDQIRGSVPPPDMCIFIRYMVPSMSFSERVDMLGGMFRFAPAEIFEMFRGAAQSALAPADYEMVARKVGFGDN